MTIRNNETQAVHKALYSIQALNAEYESLAKIALRKARRFPRSHLDFKMDATVTLTSELKNMIEMIVATVHSDTSRTTNIYDELASEVTDLDVVDFWDIAETTILELTLEQAA